MTTTPRDTDRLTRFLIEGAGVRGVLVHLDDTWRRIAGNDDYPPAVRAMLGEATAAAALFTGHAKVEGRLSVQLRGTGELRTLFAECTAIGTLRGIARLAGEDAGDTAITGLGGLGEDAILAITVENPGTRGREPARYQGLVSLAADDLSAAFEDYFRQSEQLPTRVLLAADDDRAAGLMLQKLPGDEGDADGWDRASALFSTLAPAELLDVEGEGLLLRLFHEDGVRVLGGRDLAFGCSCSRERVAAVLVALGAEEASAAVIDGLARVRCEFCGQAWEFDRDGIDALFTDEQRSMEAPQRLQ